MDGSSEVNHCIESSVGTLVWVRRRNGSWWPGRILGPEELPGSHLLSPRTGTPVKLLGREDGSVDWYNIEKSRRVKAFRCGDFDECIERAKSLASVLTKKREKYARREDAILHALELEKKYAEQNRLQESNLSSLDNNYKRMGLADDDMVIDGDMERIPCQSDFQNDFMDPESSTDAAQASLDNLFGLQNDRKFLEQEWEDNFVGNTPRIRGLQNFSLRTTSLKDKKGSWATPYDEAQDTGLMEDENKIVSCVTRNPTLCSGPNGFRTVSGTLSAVSKRKRASHLGVSEDENMYKKRDCRKPLTRVLDGGVELADPNLKRFSHLVAPGRNEYAIMQLKQESLPQAFDLKASLGATSVGLWQGPQIESMSRPEKIDYSIAMDKSCSSFADHMKLNCCDGQPYHYGSSHIDVSTLTGSVFVDSLLHGGTGLRSSFFQGSGYGSFVTGTSNNSLEQMSSLSMVESLSNPLTNFPIWSNYSHMTDYAFENVVPNSIPHIFNLYDNNIEDNSVFARRSMYDLEGSLAFSRNNINLDPVRATTNSSDIAAEEAMDEEKFLAKEDAADSPKPIPGSSICSSKLSEDTCSKQMIAVVSPTHYDSFGENEERITNTFKEFDSEAGMHNVQGMADPPNEYNKLASYRFPVSKWQRKGKRWTYARNGSTWKVTSIKALLDNTDIEKEEVQESQISVDDFTVNKSFWGSGCKNDIDLSQADEQESEKADLEFTQAPYLPNHDGRDSFGADNENVSKIRKSLWIDVPVNLHATTPQSDDLPIVSLISKLNGKVIVGHPVLVEIIHKNLEGGHVGACSSSNVNRTKKFLLQPVWRTARRRTAMQRVPRWSGIFIPQGHAQEILAKQPQQSLARHKNGVKRKSGSLSSRNKRRPQKHTTPFPQKTRMLSSIAKEQVEGTSAQVESRPSCPLVVTCIPVNVIFNRIREVLFREANQAPSDVDNIT